MTLYCTEVAIASTVHSFDRKHAFRAYDSDNVDIVYIYGHAHVKVLQYQLSLTKSPLYILAATL